MLRLNILLLLFCFTLGASGTRSLTNDSVMLKIKKINRTEKSLNIFYEVVNLSHKDIWVCVATGAKKIDKALTTGIVKIVDTKEYALGVEIKSINTYDFLIDGPLGAFYVLLKSKETKDFSILLHFPVIDNSEWDFMLVRDNNKKKQKKSIISKDIKELFLRVGYYPGDLLEQEKGCCVVSRKRYPRGYRKVYYDWAREHKEKVLEVKVDFEVKE